jgi:hypothetical protein
MAVILNKKAFEHAKKLVREGKVVADERDAWSEHQPSTQEENDFINAHEFAACGK